jgi:hypothetical protein
MSSRHIVSEEHIARLLLEEDDVSEREAPSEDEIEHNVEVANAESDNQDEPSDQENSPLDLQERSSSAVLEA